MSYHNHDYEERKPFVHRPIPDLAKEEKQSNEAYLIQNLQSIRRRAYMDGMESEEELKQYLLRIHEIADKVLKQVGSV